METGTIKGKEYQLDTIKVGEGRALRRDNPNDEDFQDAFIAASLRAAGHSEVTADWLKENVALFTGEYNDLLKKAFSVNGIDYKVSKPGEEQPPVEAAKETPEAA